MRLKQEEWQRPGLSRPPPTCRPLRRDNTASMLSILRFDLPQDATLLCQLHFPGFARAGQMLARLKVNAQQTINSQQWIPKVAYEFCDVRRVFSRSTQACCRLDTALPPSNTVMRTDRRVVWACCTDNQLQ